MTTLEKRSIVFSTEANQLRQIGIILKPIVLNVNLGEGAIYSMWAWAIGFSYPT
jgi:hypothetical protein